MSGDITDAGYLDLDLVLAAQHLGFDAHEEPLFINDHQASER